MKLFALLCCCFINLVIFAEASETYETHNRAKRGINRRDRNNEYLLISTVLSIAAGLGGRFTGINSRFEDEISRNLLSRPPGDRRSRQNPNVMIDFSRIDRRFSGQRQGYDNFLDVGVPEILREANVPDQQLQNLQNLAQGVVNDRYRAAERHGGPDRGHQQSISLFQGLSNWIGRFREERNNTQHDELRRRQLTAASVPDTQGNKQNNFWTSLLQGRFNYGNRNLDTLNRANLQNNNNNPWSNWFRQIQNGANRNVWWSNFLPQNSKPPNHSQIQLGWFPQN